MLTNNKHPTKMTNINGHLYYKICPYFKLPVAVKIFARSSFNIFTCRSYCFSFGIWKHIESSIIDEMLLILINNCCPCHKQIKNWSIDVVFWTSQWQIVEAVDREHACMHFFLSLQNRNFEILFKSNYIYHVYII